MSTPEQAATVGLLVRQYDAVREQTKLTLTQTIRRLWWQFLTTRPGERPSPGDVRRIAAAAAGSRPGGFSVDRMYDESEVADLARAMARASRTAQRRSASLSGQFQQQLLTALGESRTRTRFRVDLPDRPRGIDPDEVWRRPAVELRYQRSIDVTDVDALERALRRAEIIGEDDVTLAEREGARQALLAAATVTGYRRVIRPELSRSGTCGLCIAASDRLYFVQDLLPIHARCNCTVVPVIGDVDPGQRLNRADLQRLYDAAGSTAAADLKRIRATVHAHGELGPVLRRAEHEFRDQDDVERDRRSAA